ncbi:unnamed protein product [Amoebophrya sp. A25]|nr:unnamed protein product [Amoebophrya sp. A25]|eukprot:GSA25T00026526001.1
MPRKAERLRRAAARNGASQPSASHQGASSHILPDLTGVSASSSQTQNTVLAEAGTGPAAPSSFVSSSLTELPSSRCHVHASERAGSLSGVCAFKTPGEMLFMIHKRVGVSGQTGENGEMEVRGKPMHVPPFNEDVPKTALNTMKTSFARFWKNTYETNWARPSEQAEIKQADVAQCFALQKPDDFVYSKVSSGPSKMVQFFEKLLRNDEKKVDRTSARSCQPFDGSRKNTSCYVFRRGTANAVGMGNQTPDGYNEYYLYLSKVPDRTKTVALETRVTSWEEDVSLVGKIRVPQISADFEVADHVKNIEVIAFTDEQREAAITKTGFKDGALKIDLDADQTSSGRVFCGVEDGERWERSTAGTSKNYTPGGKAKAGGPDKRRGPSTKPKGPGRSKQSGRGRSPTGGAGTQALIKDRGGGDDTAPEILSPDQLLAEQKLFMDNLRHAISSIAQGLTQTHEDKDTFTRYMHGPNAKRMNTPQQTLWRRSRYRFAAAADILIDREFHHARQHLHSQKQKGFFPKTEETLREAVAKLLRSANDNMNNYEHTWHGLRMQSLAAIRVTVNDGKSPLKEHSSDFQKVVFAPPATSGDLLWGDQDKIRTECLEPGQVFSMGWKSGASSEVNLFLPKTTCIFLIPGKPTELASSAGRATESQILYAALADYEVAQPPRFGATEGAIKRHWEQTPEVLIKGGSFKTFGKAAPVAHIKYELENQTTEGEQRIRRVSIDSNFGGTSGGVTEFTQWLQNNQFTCGAKAVTYEYDHRYCAGQVQAGNGRPVDSGDQGDGDDICRSETDVPEDGRVTTFTHPSEITGFSGSVNSVHEMCREDKFIKLMNWRKKAESRLEAVDNGLRDALKNTLDGYEMGYTCSAKVIPKLVLGLDLECSLKEVPCAKFLTQTLEWQKNFADKCIQFDPAPLSDPKEPVDYRQKCIAEDADDVRTAERLMQAHAKAMAKEPLKRHTDPQCPSGAAAIAVFHHSKEQLIDFKPWLRDTAAFHVALYENLLDTESWRDFDAGAKPVAARAIFFAGRKQNNPKNMPKTVVGITNGAKEWGWESGTTTPNSCFSEQNANSDDENPGCVFLILGTPRGLGGHSYARLLHAGMPDYEKRSERSWSYGYARHGFALPLTYVTYTSDALDGSTLNTNIRFDENFGSSDGGWKGFQDWMKTAADRESPSCVYLPTAYKYRIADGGSTITEMEPHHTRNVQKRVSCPEEELVELVGKRAAAAEEAAEKAAAQAAKEAAAQASKEDARALAPPNQKKKSKAAQKPGVGKAARKTAVGKAARKLAGGKAARKLAGGKAAAKAGKPPGAGRRSGRSASSFLAQNEQKVSTKSFRGSVVGPKPRTRGLLQNRSEDATPSRSGAETLDPRLGDDGEPVDASSSGEPMDDSSGRLLEPHTVATILLPVAFFSILVFAFHRRKGRNKVKTNKRSRSRSSPRRAVNNQGSGIWGKSDLVDWLWGKSDTDNITENAEPQEQVRDAEAALLKEEL